ncbi:MAG: preprotein translocase subunit SecD [Halanaeroarchaeum sp.]
MSAIREYWRVSLLVVLVLVSTVALFAPGLDDGGTGPGTVRADGPTNLDYGLDLSGGARVRAVVDGVTATGIATDVEQNALRSAVANATGVPPSDVRIVAREGGTAVEVYGNVTVAELRDALASTSYDPATIRVGVTESTRTEIVETLAAKVDASGFGGTTVQSVQSQTGEGTHYIVVEAANRNVSTVRELLSSRGVVRIVASYPKNGSQATATVLSQEELRAAGGQIGLPRTSQGQPVVPITLSDQVAEEFASEMVQYGFAQDAAASQCTYANGSVQYPSYCLLTIRDGSVVYHAGVKASLADSFANGEFVKDPQFVITATSMEEARQLSVDLRAGALPAPLTVVDTFYMAPSMGAKFKLYSLITGLLAVFAVSGAVFARYREPKIALPMIVTALAEVYLLLGFAATAGLALNLSHIAGLIAVVGTGVDDLVIIADEVMAEQVSSSRVFQSRFRKALWVIGAAAATTIIAMSPLAVLSLGDLRGFAIITILGVLIGVLLTRPAYGDILRRLLTRDR